MIVDEPNFTHIQTLLNLEKYDKELVNHAFNLVMLMIVEFLRKNFVESEI